MAGLPRAAHLNSALTERKNESMTKSEAILFSGLIGSLLVSVGLNVYELVSNGFFLYLLNHMV